VREMRRRMNREGVDKEGGGCEWEVGGWGVQVQQAEQKNNRHSELKGKDAWLS
jgi:hypothetical protein